jgi:hypothetical protein
MIPLRASGYPADLAGSRLNVRASLGPRLAVTGPIALGLALLAATALLAVTVLLAATMASMLKGAVILATLVWFLASRRDRRNVRLRANLHRLGHRLATEAVRRPLPTLLTILGLGVVAAVSVTSLVLIVLAGLIVCIVLWVLARRLAAGIGRIMIGRRGGQGAKGSDIAGAIRVRHTATRIGTPRPTVIPREPPEPTDEPVALRILVRLAHPAEQEAAASLAIRAVAAMRQTLRIPPPKCDVRGGALLEVAFHVCDPRRGRQHDLSEAQANIWDLFHEYRIAFTFPPSAATRPDVDAA